MRGQFHCRRLGEADHAMLGRVIRRRSRDGGQRVDTRDLHDRSAGGLLGHHLPGDELCEEKRPLQVDVEHTVPLGLAHLQKGLHEIDAGIVDEGVDPAEAVDRCRTERLQIGTPRYVSGKRQCHAAAGDDLGCDGFVLRSLAIGHHHLGASRGAATGDRAAKAAGGARHDHDSIFKTLHTRLLRAAV